MYKVIIADDDIGVPTGLSSYFPWSEYGFDVVAKCSSGKQVIEYLSSHSADVLISDICMPEMSGLDLVRELRVRHPQMQIVLLSAYKNFQYAKEAMSYGIRHYLVKPATYSEIKDVINEIRDELKCQTAKPGAANTQQASAFNAKIIAQIKIYIDEHYATVTLSEIAALVHMNISYLSRFFKQTAGENISAYLMRIRMEHALRMLQDIHYKNIYDIALKIGYTNAKSFTKAFKAFYGLTPQEYRKSFHYD